MMPSVAKKTIRLPAKYQQGSVMVESALGMSVIMVMLMAMIWYFEVMDFATQGEIEAGIDLRNTMLAGNAGCYNRVNVDRVRSINSSFNLGSFIGQNSQRFDIQYQKTAWTGSCQSLGRSRFHNKNPYRRFRGPNGGVRGSW